ncbi:unnamed protein product [Orchesella dallaii]|uniref:Uncharacterized protein n=1 Tax=Orchesella dallaii TaxID=48710 RepID=A0ABP1R4Z2_9HEXA
MVGNLAINWRDIPSFERMESMFLIVIVLAGVLIQTNVKVHHLMLDYLIRSLVGFEGNHNVRRWKPPPTFTDKMMLIIMNQYIQSSVLAPLFGTFYFWYEKCRLPVTPAIFLLDDECPSSSSHHYLLGINAMTMSYVKWLHFILIAANASLCDVIVFGSAGRVYVTSRDTIRRIQRKPQVQETLWAKRFFRSCPPLKVQLGHVNFFDQLSPLMFVDFSINQIVNLLLVK